MQRVPARLQHGSGADIAHVEPPARVGFALRLALLVDVVPGQCCVVAGVDAVFEVVQRVDALSIHHAVAAFTRFAIATDATAVHYQRGRCDHWGAVAQATADGAQTGASSPPSAAAYAGAQSQTGARFLLPRLQFRRRITCGAERRRRRRRARETVQHRVERTAAASETTSATFGATPAPRFRFQHQQHRPDVSILRQRVVFVS